MWVLHAGLEYKIIYDVLDLTTAGQQHADLDHASGNMFVCVLEYISTHQFFCSGRY